MATPHTDGFRPYGIAHMGGGRHRRVRHCRDEFVRGSPHVGGIGGFWGAAEARLVKFKGMSGSTCYLHPKGWGFRYKHRDEDRYQLPLQITRSAFAI
jgi:hypothetical protein